MVIPSGLVVAACIAAFLCFTLTFYIRSQKLGRTVLRDPAFLLMALTMVVLFAHLGVHVTHPEAPTSPLFLVAALALLGLGVVLVRSRRVR